MDMEHKKMRERKELEQSERRKESELEASSEHEQNGGGGEWMSGPVRQAGDGRNE